MSQHAALRAAVSLLQATLETLHADERGSLELPLCIEFLEHLSRMFNVTSTDVRDARALLHGTTIRLAEEPVAPHAVLVALRLALQQLEPFL